MEPSQSEVDNRLQCDRKRERILEAEVRSLYAQLDWMTSRKIWRIVQSADRIIYWLRHILPVERLWSWAGAVKGIPRRLGLDRMAAWARRPLRQVKNRGWLRATPRADETAPPAEIKSGGYDVICLPVISWNSRFQRPQQMMRRVAERGHRVFYASLEFHTGEAARLSPLREGVLETMLPGVPGTSVYNRLPSRDEVRRMAEAIDRLRRERRIASAVVVVQLPFWTALAEKLREQFGWPIIYDCMDDHSGFSTNCAAMLRMEKRIVAEADLVVVTSDVLEAKVRPKVRRMALIRNACDYDHFANAVNNSNSRGLTAPGGETRDSSTIRGLLAPGYFDNPSARVTIGFYGAIAEWFDADLVADLAELRPRWRFELIGSTYTGDVSRLEKLPNVKLLGEKPYTDLPRFVAEWDAFIIPFKRIPLTEATNPVKAYEMLATGKPVAAVDLPELRPMARDGLLSLADDARGFAEALERELTEDCDRRRQGRRKFAARNTWKDRDEALDREIRRLFPPASIIIVTYNNLHLNQGCLESVFRDTDWPNFEVIVVDNASSDGTVEWLGEEEARRPNLRVILNTENRGFSAANNQGLQAARGEFLCLMNNDTLVTRGWLSTLIGHLRAMPEVGMIGPVSNQVGNEAKVSVDYTTTAEMPRWAAEYCRRHDSETFLIPMLGFFCVVFQRDFYENAGKLDERFGIGCFEDDDYCRRARRLGYELCCARDAFVHHWLEASFRLLGKDRYLSIFQENKQRYEAKWDADKMASAY